MKRLIAVLMMSVALLTVVSCTKEVQQDSVRLPEPELLISDVTSTSFVVSWSTVNDAGSYTYMFGEESVTTKERTVTFADLLPDTEYVFSIKADAGYNGNYEDSRLVTAHVITENETVLGIPEPELVAAYKSKTIISWKSVSGADAYEYTVGQKQGKVEGNSVELSGFEGNTEYVFRIRAVSSRPYVNPSPEAELAFVTSPDSEDIPEIIIDYIESGADYVNFNIYALPDCGYFYFAIPAAYFADHTEQEIQEIYRDYVVEAIIDAGYTLSSGVATLSSYGSANYTEYPLYPEMSYYIVAFGLDSKGKVATTMYKQPFKTIANDHSSGPDIKGAEWFTQSLFLSTFGGYNPSNCIWAKWVGKDVKEVSYLLTSTYSYKTYFESSPELFQEYIASNGSKVDDEETYEAINSQEGLTSRFSLSPATSYTMGVVAVNDDGESTFVVNTMATKGVATYYDWMFLELGTSDAYPAESALSASVSISYDMTEILNLQIQSGRYYFCPSAELADVSASQAGEVVKEKGEPLSSAQIRMLNMTGRIAISFGTDGIALQPGTRYTLIVSLESVSGDEVIRFISASTLGEPVSTRSGLSTGSGRFELKQSVILNTIEFAACEE